MHAVIAENLFERAIFNTNPVFFRGVNAKLTSTQYT